MNIVSNFLLNRNNYSLKNNIKGSNYNPNMSYPNLRPLSKDTVSFGSTIAKKAAKKGGEATYDVARRVVEAALQVQKDFFRLIRQKLERLQASQARPENPILPGKIGIHGTHKSIESLMDKATNGGLSSIDELKAIGDVIRVRIVLRDAKSKGIDEIFAAFGQMVKKGELKIKEIENYRLSPKQSYVSSKTLDKFQEICSSVGLYPDIKNKIHPKGYTAIHLNVELEDGWVGEIQIMGREMEVVKEIEDFYYKILTCDKPLDAKYKEIETVIKSKLNKLNDFQRQTLEQYIKDSYSHAFGVAPKHYKKKISTNDFLPLPYSLPQELSYENLYKMKLQCDREAQKAKAKKN